VFRAQDEKPAYRRSDHCFGAHARTWLTAPLSLGTQLAQAAWLTTVDVQPMRGAREHAGRRRR